MRRTWRERLFTRPWHPLQRTKTITPQVPKRGGYFIGQNQMIVHPAFAAELRRQLAGTRVTDPT